MKPRTKLDFKVIELAKTLPAITNEQKSWFFENSLKHIGYRLSSNKVYCLSCGHSFQGMQILPTMECDCCSRKLHIEDTRKKKNRQRKIVAIITTCKGFQVNRYFEIDCFQRSGTAPEFHIWEVSQQWMDEMGAIKIYGLQRNWTYYHDTFTGCMEIRSWDKYRMKYDLWPYEVYPKMRVLSIFRRNGFRSSFYGISPYQMFSKLLSNNRFETLLKAKQYDLLRSTVGNSHGRSDRHWNSIKIAIRNNYKVKDASMWFDQLDLLQKHGKDLRSPKYVCSVNLALDHKRMIEKDRRESKRQELERKKRKLLQDEEMYLKTKGIFFGLEINDRDLSIKVIDSVKGFIEEAERFRHCVYANSYFSKEKSLILSACVKGRPVETVEVDLDKMKVVQSRGIHNRASSYNQDIVDLVNKNMCQIAMRMEGKQKKAS